MKVISPNILAYLLLFLSSTTVLAQNLAKQWHQIQTARFDKPVRDWFFAPKSFASELQGVAIHKTELTWVGTPELKSLVLPDGHITTTFSKDGRFFVVGAHLEIPNHPAQKSYELRVFSSQREEDYVIRELYYLDQPFAAAIISSKGRIVLGQNSTGELQFYDPTGRLEREVTLFPEAFYDLERFIQVDLSEDGTRVAVLASKRGASPAGSTAPNPSGEPQLFLFNQRGDEIWSKPLPHFNAAAMAISPNGKTIVASGYTVDMAGTFQNTTWLVDDTGTTTGAFDLLFKRKHFSANSEFVIVANNQQVHILDVKTNQILWTKLILGQEGMIAAVRVSNDGKLAALLLGTNSFENGEFVFRNPKLKMFNRTEEEDQEMALEGTFVTPSLAASPNLARIVAGLNRGYQVFARVDEN